MLVPLTIASIGLLILGIKHLAERGTGPLAVVARVLLALGSFAVLVAVVATIASAAAVLALVGMVLLFMIPLLLIGSSVGTGRRSTYPRRY